MLADSLAGEVGDVVRVLERPNVDAKEARSRIGLFLARLDERLLRVEAGTSGAGAASWDTITGKPTAFPPAAHNHDSVYSAVGHAHTIANVTGLQAALDGKQPAGSYAAATHAHALADVTGLGAALDAKADDTDLTAHVNAADPHTGYQRESEKGAANGYASLGADGKVPAAQLPAASGNPGLTAVGGWQDFVLANDDVSTAAVTNRNLSGFVWAMAANAVYIIDLYLLYQPAAATTGLGLAFDTAVAVTSQGLTFEHQLATGGTLSGGDSIADAAARGLSSGVPAAALTPVLGKGVVKVAAQAGNCQLIWRPEVAAVATMKAGSAMVVKRVA